MSTKEDRRRVGLYPDKRVAPLLKTVGGKSTAGSNTKKRKSESDDSTNGDIRSQFDRGGTKENAEPAYIPGSYKGTAFRGSSRKLKEGSSGKTPPEQKPKFKTYAPIAARPSPPKPTFKDYGAGNKEVRPTSPVRKPTFKTYASSAAPPKPIFKDYGASEKPVFNTYGGATKNDSHDSDSDEQIYLSSQLPPADTNETKCPMCGTTVPLPLLLDFAAAFPSVDPFSMRIQVQSRFCSHHRRHTAASSENYPSIDWRELPSRIRAHLPSIRALDDPAAPSHYRDILAEDIAAGRNRTLMQTIMSEAGSRVRMPGYYGPRGARVIQDEILDVLSEELREAAVRDVVVSARGVGVYVTSVLVLEVGLLLIMDDLGVGREDAREVMEKSAAWGMLVNEEIDERGEGEEEDDDDEYD